MQLLHAPPIRETNLDLWISVVGNVDAADQARCMQISRNGNDELYKGEDRLNIATKQQVRRSEREAFWNIKHPRSSTGQIVQTRRQPFDTPATLFDYANNQEVVRMYNTHRYVSQFLERQNVSFVWTPTELSTCLILEGIYIRFSSTSGIKVLEELFAENTLIELSNRNAFWHCCHFFQTRAHILGRSMRCTYIYSQANNNKTTTPSSCKRIITELSKHLQTRKPRRI